MLKKLTPILFISSLFLLLTLSCTSSTPVKPNENQDYSNQTKVLKDKNYTELKISDGEKVQGFANRGILVYAGNGISLLPVSPGDAVVKKKGDKTIYFPALGIERSNEDQMNSMIYGDMDKDIESYSNITFFVPPLN